jgi:hypothetical protein
MGRDATTKKRQELLRIVERSIVPERPLLGRRGSLYIVRPTVTAACAPSLGAIASAVSDETHHIDEASLGALPKFLRDGASPFFGYDPAEALRAAVGLQHMIPPAALLAEPRELEDAVA